MCLESVLECALMALAIIACEAICISSAMDACNTQHAEVLTNIGTDQTINFLCLSAGQLQPCHCSITTGHAAWMNPRGGNQCKCQHRARSACVKDSLLAGCSAPHGIAEEVIVAQRDVPILASCNARSFHSLILCQHVVGKAAAACIGLAGCASLWC